MEKRRCSGKIVVGLKISGGAGKHGGLGVLRGGNPLLTTSASATSTASRDYITGVADKTISALAPEPVRAPLVIPLPGNAKKSPDVTNTASVEVDADAAAVEALLVEANGEDDDGRSASKVPAVAAIVPTATMTKGAPLLQGVVENESDRYKTDLAESAQNVDARSECYSHVPITDFGEAILRGMGWDGSRSEANQVTHARPARLGLGAKARPPSPPAAHKSRRPGEKKGKGQNVKDAEWAKEAERKIKSQKLRAGDIVWLRDPRFVRKSSVQRARVVKTTGVPGLNKIEVMLEGTGESAAVLQSDAILLGADELTRDPFKDSGRKRENSADEAGESKRVRRDDTSRRREDTGRTAVTWVMSGLRVRFVGAGEHHRMKGDVIKVAENGSVKLQLDNGAYLDGLAEEALETVVPSTDDDVRIVRGPLRMRKGRIRSKDRDREKLCVIVDGRKEELSFDDVSALSRSRR
jgi:hypothetical protein